MEINFFIEEYIQLGNLPFLEMLYRLFFWYFGWLPVAIAFLYGVSQLWLDYVSGKWSGTQKFICLAIDVPRNNEQSPKAVENLFTYLIGTQSGPNLIEQWWEGRYQLGFSFEIVGIDGYIQFLIRTPAGFRPIIESAVYSQYPDAEITAVDDYAQFGPKNFPDPDYDIWGAEFTYTAPYALPIKVYRQFEHQFGEPETVYKDPMGAFLDMLSSLKRGEQFWFQLLLTPIDNGWTKGIDDFITKTIGPKPEQILQLPPIKKRQIEAASEKKNKVAFKSKIRVIYLSRKEIMDKAKVVNGFVGYMRQFGENNLNGFMPYKRTATSTAYFRAAERLNVRKENIIAAYRSRSSSKGGDAYVMNVEELATLWHFPLDAVVKAPLLQRASAKRIEAPMSLPTAEEVSMANNVKVETIFDKEYVIADEVEKPKSVEKKGDFADFLSAEIAKEEKQEQASIDAPPDNLPFV